MVVRGLLDPIFTNTPHPIMVMLLAWVRPYTVIAELESIDKTLGANVIYKIQSGKSAIFYTCLGTIHNVFPVGEEIC